MNESWAIAIFGVVITAFGALLAIVLRHLDQCKDIHGQISEISEIVQGIRKEIGDHETGMRGQLHRTGRTLAYHGGCFWMIAQKLDIDLPKREDS